MLKMISTAVAEATRPNRSEENLDSSVKLNTPKFVRHKESDVLNLAAPRDFIVQYRSWLENSARGAPMHRHLLNAMEGTVAVAFATDAELAREKLHLNKIRMSKEGTEGLLPYIGIFRDVVRDVGMLLI